MLRRILAKGVKLAAAALTLLAMATASRAETWTASYQFPPGDLRDDAMRSIAHAMEAQDLTIRLYAAASLLRPADQWSALIGGGIDMVFMPTDYLLDRFPQLAVLSLPTMIRSRDQAGRISVSPAMRDLKRQIEAAGVVILVDSWIPGAYASRQRCVLHPADAKGLRARTIGRFMSEYWAGAGAQPVPVATSEALGTLVSNDLIDIANTSAATLLSLRMERKFACLTVPGEAGAMWYLYEPIMVSKRRYESLSDAQRQALHAAADEAEANLSTALSLLERRLAGNFIAAGVDVVKLDGEAMEAWRRLARRTAWKSFRDHVAGGADLLDKMQAVE